jgi:glycerophosphoryl diester phosphodiesterase
VTSKPGWVLALTATLSLGPVAPGLAAGECPREPLVIAHRGASGHVPEHTVAAYLLAIEQGADLIEPDLVMTRDGVLVARHENELSDTTDVADHVDFATRRTTRTIDGREVTGWFSEDFTLAELATLRTRERLPELRATNTRHDGLFGIVTFSEVLALLRAANELRATHDAIRGLARRAPVGVAPELKHPDYFEARGLPMEAEMTRILREHGYGEEDRRVWVQSFEPASLRKLGGIARWQRALLLEAETPVPPLDEVKAYAEAIAIHKSTLTRDLVSRAHAAGLQVQAWTYRAENHFLPEGLQRGSDPAAHGDLEGELRAAYDLCVDAVFADHPDAAVRARR